MLVRPELNSRPPARQADAQPTEPPVAGDQYREIPAAGFDELLQPWTTTTAAHNVATTRRKQQLLNSFSQIKIYLFFPTKTPNLHTELATFFRVLL